ncbi:MAG TPA: methyltransferase domain-containing protein [Euzebyales bacterium]|nr:methyltransferase domain-containing protein [Euzebyales bacterium]
MCPTATPIAHVLDLGSAPVVVGETPVDGPQDVAAPLRLGRCHACGVLQVEDALSDAARELVATATSQRAFAGRPDGARRFCEEAIDRWRLRGDGHIIELGSGTGSLLRFFCAWQLPVLGIEADPRLTRYARLRRIPTWRAVFDSTVADRIARSGMHADLLIVSMPTGAFAHLGQLLDTAATVLRPGGVLTLEVPDLLRVVGRTRFDAVRHADRVIPSLRQFQDMVTDHGFDVVDIQRAEMTDDRLRVWIRGRQEGASMVGHPRMRTRLRAEAANTVEHPATVAAFAGRADLVRRQIRGLLDHAREQQCTVAVWGTSHEAVTLAAVERMDRQTVAYAVDPAGIHGCAALQGTDIPILGPADVADRRPDLVLALDDLAEPPPGWEGVPIYAVHDLVDVVHRLTDVPHVHFVR